MTEFRYTLGSKNREDEVSKEFDPLVQYSTGKEIDSLLSTIIRLLTLTNTALDKINENIITLSKRDVSDIYNREGDNK